MAKKNESVVDLTADDETGGKKAEKQKKAPKSADGASGKAAEGADGKKKGKGAKGKKKKGGKLKAALIIILLLVIVVGGFIFEEWQFNLLGMRTKFFELRTVVVAEIAKLDPEYKPYSDKLIELSSREAEIAKREMELDAREMELDEWETKLRKREDAAAALEAEVAEREIKLTPIYRLPLSDEDRADMESLARTYASMDAATAAGIITSLYDKQDMAAILYYMAERSAAPILAAMDTNLAADLTEILLYK